MLAITIPILLYVLAFFFCSLFLLTSYLFWQKGKHKRFLIEVERYMQKYEQTWFAILIEGKQPPITAIPKKRAHYFALERIFLMYLQQYNTTKIRRTVLQFANDYMTDFYEQELQQPSWSKKMNALYRIYDFRLVALLPACQKVDFQKLDEDMQLQLFKIFATLQPKKLFEIVIEQQWPLAEIDYKQLFMIIEAEAFNYFVTHFHALPDAAKYALIDTSYMQQKLYAIPMLERLLQHEAPEIRIRTLKALFHFKHVPSLQLYTHFATSTIWQERMLVAKILRYFPIEQSQSLLEQLLQDANYSVRLEASRTFASSKHGEHWLQLFLTTSTDRYAVDMVNATLQQKKV